VAKAISSKNRPIRKSKTTKEGQLVRRKPAFSFPPIAGFWRRLFAWLLDIVILGLIGQLLSLLFSSFLFSIGPYGRPIGLVFTIPYFGIMNSEIGGGQTLGKRLMKIAVRNKDNHPIELGRSIIRILLLAVPSLFNQWAIPPLQNPVVQWLVAVVVFGLGGATIYLMVFNRTARQGVHDLLLGTYVVKLGGTAIKSFPTTPRLHWIVGAAWLGMVATGSLIASIVAPSVISESSLAPVMNLYYHLQNDPRFFTVGVSDTTFSGSNTEPTRVLVITAWYKGKLEEGDSEDVIQSIVKAVLENSENIDDYDGIQVRITTAYDIGIASANVTLSFGNSIEGWRREIYPNSTSS
jgi:uncharacterized RDD family membrane protein YckC